MKNKVIKIAAALMSGCLCVGGLTACDDMEMFFSDVESLWQSVGEDILADIEDDGVYEISYTDDTGYHTIVVEKGQSYSISSIPSKVGYDFVGLFDAETGGTQYVDAVGNCLAPYGGKRDIVLYPQYTAKQYTVYFNANGGMCDAEDKRVISFGEQIVYVPNAQKEGHNFMGWSANKDGREMISNGSALMLEYFNFNEKLAEKANENREVWLYANFQIKTFAITAHFTNGDMVVENVEYGANVHDIAAFKTEHNGFIVTQWKLSETPNASFDGIVRSELHIYPAEEAKAVTITFNGNGVDSPEAKVVAANTTIALPTLSRSNYKFNGWQVNGTGKIINELQVGETDINLTAEWTRIYAGFSSYSTLTIEDVHTHKNSYDYINMANLFGKSMAQLRSEGYSKITMKAYIAIEEKNDGYQEIYFGTNVELDTDAYCGWGRLWGKDNIDTSGSQTYYIASTYDLGLISDNMYFCYSANGAFGDTWYRRSINVEFHLS